MYTSIQSWPIIILKQLALAAAWAIVSHVSGLSVVTSHAQVQRYRERKMFSSGQMASGHLPAIHTHTRTNVTLVRPIMVCLFLIIPIIIPHIIRPITECTGIALAVGAHAPGFYA